ncbi:MAG: ChbG/HpnK family deacetylase [Deltaproteobacteria bacterium]|nr:ChbG/HpnK family deacetylase [Deltaproteobacteria bacterium]
MGATPTISRRIAQAWREGLLDGFSILANGDGLDEVAEVLREEGDRAARVAVHLNLSEGRSVAQPAEVPLLVDEAGFLHHTFGSLLVAWLFSSRASRADLVAQVEREWRAQVDEVVALLGARGVQAIDGHVHVHMLPFLFPVAARLAREFGLLEVRITDEPFHLSERPRDSLSPLFVVNIVKHAALRACAQRARGVAREAGIAGPDRFVGVLYTGRMTREAARAGIRVAERRGASSVEVLFHIGRAAPEEAARWSGNPAVGAFPLDAGRDREFEELNRLVEGD